MHIMQSRRDFLSGLSAAGAAGLVGARKPLADEGPVETTTVRLRHDPSICVAPLYIAEDLLRAEGFTDVRYVPARAGLETAQMIGRGEIDFVVYVAASLVSRLDEGLPATVLAGVHPGCFELFAHEPIRTISDLKGKKVGIDVLGGAKHRYLAIMAANVGLDPHEDIQWVEGSALNPSALFPMELFVEGRVDAFLGFPPEPQKLRASKVGRVILNTTTDKPWSQYFCCMLVGHREFVRAHPIATKRVLRAILKANGICAAEPERAAQQLVDGGFTEQYDYALETLSEIPYRAWREFDPEDTIRFYALRLHEAGLITSIPKQIIAEGTDWRFLNELKRELKA
ncbi:MAG TPA: ABC transporter substrate-binding protein [Vicinamibacterales bacterium]|nr:ABC transporter substrate-binding protein [Vicinamibacterales bacterium]